MDALTKVFSTIMAVLLMLTASLNTIFNGDVYPYESVTRTVGFETFERSQGVTNDGENWYFSGKSSLTKVNIETGETVLRNLSPFEGLEEYNSSHIGGISYYNGYIYAGVEDSKAYQYPLVAVFDAETLEFTGRKVVFDTSLMSNGCPWVCCDAEKGVFYIGECDDTKELYCYDLNTLEYVDTIPLGGVVDEIQGAEMYEGIMYAATNDITRAVYEIDLEGGTVEKYFDRIMYEYKLIDNFGGEGEGITVLPMQDGTVFHALDLGAMFIDSNLRHYKPIDKEKIS